ncbi:hypothetical protein A3D77_05100 [Candidatus Gottesmanbacteria bacterium RIFCSPHIGHO2_02_FULL_39_11]|uniref:Glycosyltransferase RgtA/B/C/D-like domain-containing protein n=1 Tax=Candidatus Gottesmanbacteria bacterium RIFCSPHIGHO2_02_FULL_39_11 TaxID=1798382 RepID=A0A1F5ZLY9_9BACT|nr:MAG: hypothetical protein A3D77_05100 [Candidatus Gottesmanbacteria bacterium RIFCSPHIGHO2_02_FULL_39_11]
MRVYGVIFLILLFAFILLSTNLSKPFIGQHDWNGAFWGNLTRNYLAHFAKLTGNSNWHTLDRVHPNELVFFHHYTPLLPVLFTATSILFGFNEVSLRLLTLLLSLVMVFFIYKIGNLLYSKEVGLLASLFTLLTPMFLYYGTLTDHEPVLVPLGTAAFYFYLTFKKSEWHRIVFFMFLLLMLLESWGGYFLAAGIVIHSWVFQKNKRLSLHITVIAIGVLLFHFFSIAAIKGPQTVVDFFRYGLFRINGSPDAPASAHFTFIQYITTELRYGIIYFTRILILLSLTWFISLIGKKRHISRSDISLFILFVWGISFVLVFRNLAYIHDYKLYLLLPFISLSSAYTTVSILNYVSKRVNRKISYLLLLMALLGVAFERLPYLLTLKNTSFNLPGYTLGKVIAKKTKPSDKILLISKEFDDFYGEFTRFYANREIMGKDITFYDLEKNPHELDDYHYCIVVKNRPIDQKVKDYLEEKYSYETIGDFTLFNSQI